MSKTNPYSGERAKRKRARDRSEEYTYTTLEAEDMVSGAAWYLERSYADFNGVNFRWRDPVDRAAYKLLMALTWDFVKINNEKLEAL